MVTLEERNYIIGNMKNLLADYYYDYSDSALNKIVDAWASEKGALIEAFKKHPNYKPGKFMIVLAHDYEIEIDRDGSREFCRWIRSIAREYKGGLPKDIRRKTSHFDFLPRRLEYFFWNLHEFAERCVTESTAMYLNGDLDEIKVRAGEKTTRVVNKLCTYLGYDKHPDYNKMFAKYSDSLSPKTIKRHTVLSINPLDYLTMSFGNSWASCHTIDKTNKRGMPNSYHGQYSSGTMSYMLDPSSMVLYTVDISYNGDEYWSQPKINRQMFHYGKEKLVQGRLYPQSNDGRNSFYTPYRSIVQEVISTIFNISGKWNVESGSCAASRYIVSCGTHYEDYENFSSCTLSVIDGNDNKNYFTVGADPICVLCGREHETENNISCCGGGGVYYCEDCGREISGDEVYYVDGERYCDDCIRLCECCDEYHHDVQYVDIADGYICDNCLEEHYRWCSNCASYHPIEDMVQNEDGSWSCADCTPHRDDDLW